MTLRTDGGEVKTLVVKSLTDHISKYYHGQMQFPLRKLKPEFIKIRDLEQSV